MPYQSAILVLILSTRQFRMLKCSQKMDHLLKNLTAMLTCPCRGADLAAVDLNKRAFYPDRENFLFPTFNEDANDCLCYEFQTKDFCYENHLFLSFIGQFKSLHVTPSMISRFRIAS